jgi:hypothetical protein
VFFESTHTINIKTFQKQIGQKKMDYSDTLVTFGTQNTGPRQVKPKKPQHNNTENTTLYNTNSTMKACGFFKKVVKVE